jgi:hypothetical protein
MGGKKISSFSINNRKIEGFVLNITPEGTDHQVNIKWRPRFSSFLGVGDKSTEMVCVVFHLFNFIELFGTRRTIEKSGTTMIAIEHIDLSFGEWSVELKSLIFTSNNIKALKAEGGFRLTHVGSFQKIGGIPFLGQDADNYLKSLHYFLSFAKGDWCEPSCAVGYDLFENRVWESWSSPQEPWKTPLSWFDPHHSSNLTILFPNFMSRCNNEEWNEALHEVIYWYLRANNSNGIDAGIILAQSAIERLSYEYVVKDRRLLTSNGFKDLCASDKFRLLFSSLDIPLDIPVETPKLKCLSHKNGMNWIDAPQAITEIRNSLVHPEHKRHGQFGDVCYEAWNLSLWYLELSILAICNYSGTYGNRLKQHWIGEVEEVPWKK